MKFRVLKGKHESLVNTGIFRINTQRTDTVQSFTLQQGN